MCGVLFCYRSGREPEAVAQQALCALQQMKHRGPDDSGLLRDGPAVIGHRRLSIIDLAGGHQPMEDPSGRYWLSYNGEAYNFKVLRAELAPRWEFRTTGDTEVVLAGLVLHGTDFAKRLDGMFSICLWDRRERRLLLARDPMGKKPLYYQILNDGFACASELPALRLLADPWSEDLDSTADYLRYGYHLPGTTAYQDVREVLPGHALVWEGGASTRSAPYWSLGASRFQGSELAAAEQLRETFVSAVEKRLVADVEVGAFLSGGVDSSLVVAVLAKRLGVHPKTFTIGFSESSYDEREFARLVADACGTDHYERRFDHWDSQRLKELVLDRVGQPFSDSSILPTDMVSGLAAEHVKVVLSGDGGDELFSGYQRYQARALLRWYTRLPRPLRGSIERVIQAVPEPMAHHSRSVLKKAHLFLDVVRREPLDRPYVAPLLYGEEDFAELVPDLVRRGHVPPGLAPETNLDEIQAMMAADAAIYLPQDILVKVDRASMAHSLEARAPFLDRELVELAFSLPRRWHRRGLSGKRMLHKAFDTLLPASVWRRRKQGFGVPLHDWFRGELGSELEGMLDQTQAVVSASVVRRLLDGHRARIRDHGYRLWNLYVYLLWKKHNTNAAC